MKRLRLVSAFPATGKSYLAREYPDHIVDSDSSAFSWEWMSFEERRRHPDWPNNYVVAIEEWLAAGNRTVFVSTHQELRDALVAARIPFLLVYPRADLRWEYMDRIAKRGSPQPFISKLNREWLSMMRSLQEQTGCAHVVLGPGEFLRWPL